MTRTMRLATKRSVDYYLGRPLLTVLQVAARVLGVVLRRDHSIGPVRSILIAKFQGLGSLIISKPALADLRQQYPDARILFWGTPAMVPLAEQMPEFDEILVLNDRSPVAACSSVLRALLRLWRERIDWAFDLEAYSRLSSALVTMTGARNRTGFALEQLRSRRVHTHLIYFNRYHHIGTAYARIIGQLLPEGHEVDMTDYGSWRGELDALPSIPRPYFLVNVHAGDLSLERRWPLQRFSRLIDELLRRRPDAAVVLIGHGEDEAAYTAKLHQRDGLIDLSGTLGLADTMRVVANAELVVTNDSAPLHFALSTGARTVGLFGPTRAETYMAPGIEGVTAAQVGLYCSPCVHHWEPPPCNGDNQCMKRLSVGQVLSKCCELLGLPLPEPGTHPVSRADDSPPFYAGLVYRRSSRG